MPKTLKCILAGLCKLWTKVKHRLVERPAMCYGDCDNPKYKATLLQCRTRRLEAQRAREMRAKDVAKMKRKDPNVVPIVLQPHELSRSRVEGNSLRLLLKKDVTLWQLTKMVRRRLSVPTKRSLYLFTNEESITAMGTACLTTKIGNLYNPDSCSDGFLQVFFHWQ
ncbi:microtubule-associated proteins 1A/1B light chain 3A-like [Pomacea canaliculata]|uniref:microtubule-associated proteins 1A/1B light chain 3A-like n=1 Tax=Pomacea canaliculata TaxID=400727 RepID=UPI000D73ED6A|nr:microtubule-associated proteins 1A/1B light chain 3A-like [Pomacea canaliculata]